MRCLLPLLLTVSAYAAPPAPVHWRAVAPGHAVTAGAKFDVQLTANIDSGWHLYALSEPEDGPLATEINLTEGDPADLLRTDQSRPHTVQDSVFGKPVSLFEGSATFTLHLQLGRSVSPGGHTIHILVRYQSCNDHVCLPPHTDIIEATLMSK